MSRDNGVVNLAGGLRSGHDLRVDRRREGPLVDTPSYKGYRYPAEIIAYGVWLYHRFPLSFREVEELALARRIVVSFRNDPSVVHHVRAYYARWLRRRRPQPGDTWHLDEVFITINGEQKYLWRGRRPRRHRARHPGAGSAKQGRS
jgi:hypothetical protein